MMDYTMEDNQNSAPGSVPAAQAAKLGSRPAQNAQSTTKRFATCPLNIEKQMLTKIVYKPN
jgi:ubiquitin-conjugating enzyme E2 C